VQFQGKKIAPRMYEIVLESGMKGDYGFLPPGSMSSSNMASAGKRVDLLIAKLRPTKRARILELGQPLHPMTRRVHLLPRAGNRPTPIKGFQSIHHPREILREGQIAAGEFRVRTPCSPW